METSIIIAICTGVGTVISIIALLSKQFDKIGKRFDKIDSDLKEIRGDIHFLDKRLTRIGDRIEFSGKIVYIKSDTEESKKN